MTYEEQDNLLKEIKKQPNIREKRILAIVFTALAIVFLLVGGGALIFEDKIAERLMFWLLVVGVELGLGFVIAGGILFKTSGNQIQQALAIEREKMEKEEKELKEREEALKEAEQKEQEMAAALGINPTIPTMIELTQKEMEKAEKEKLKKEEKEEMRKNVERVVQVSKTYYKLQFFIFLSLTLSFLALTFIPLCSVMGLEDVNVFDAVTYFIKDIIKGVKEGIEDHASSLRWAIENTAIMAYAFIGIFMLISTLIMTIRLLTMSSLEITIRETKGKLEVPLTEKELRAIKAKSMAGNQFNAMAVGWMLMLFLPIYFFVENRGILLVDYMMLFYVSSCFMATLALSIVACVFVHKNKKEVKTLLSIKASYKRYKIQKYKQELED
ncbi:MAG: hypothetical protein E7352_04680 [Clostridiales bacterium]|nr:hypothetical protein [Clostridiales bacterium]